MSFSYPVPYTSASGRTSLQTRPLTSNTTNTPEAGPAMCQGCIRLQEVYAECGHVKRHVVVYTCAQHPDARPEDCGAQLPHRLLYKPSLCRSCYCAEEERIFRETQHTLRLFILFKAWPRDDKGDVLIENTYQLVDYLCGRGMTSEAVSTWLLSIDFEDGQILELPRSREHIIARRDRSLQELRDEQGVWGDG